MRPCKTVPIPAWEYTYAVLAALQRGEGGGRLPSHLSVMLNRSALSWCSHPFRGGTLQICWLQSQSRAGRGYGCFQITAKAGSYHHNLLHINGIQKYVHKNEHYENKKKSDRLGNRLRERRQSKGRSVAQPASPRPHRCWAGGAQLRLRPGQVVRSPNERSVTLV